MSRMSGSALERDVDQNQGEQLFESGKKGLTEHDPRPDRADPVHGLEGVSRVGMMAERADDVGWMGQLAAARAAGKDELVVGRC